jgi:L-ascorbate metabolism protein UlaG (beta-lactamase superfamily)
MKITKFVHSCLMVEMPEPVNRTAIFDPGFMSEGVIDISKLRFLDDIIVSHGHPDHFSRQLIGELVRKFPKVRITAPPEVCAQLTADGIKASSDPSQGISFFDSPHEFGAPFMPQPPQNNGVHYLDLLSHPGDSHSFKETKKLLALPITAPWGSTIRAVQLACELKPKYVIPIHDWMWRDEWRIPTYDTLEKIFQEQGITFLKPVNGEPFVLEV